MKLSVRSEYALRALIVLGETYEQGVVRIQTISERQNIPKRFLEQILNDLRSGGFVESRRGVAGGYRLARPPQEITLADLIHYVEDALPQTPTLGDRTGARGQRPDAMAAAIASVVSEVRAAMRAVLEKLTLADLCERARKLRSDASFGLDYVI
ncbi:MAG TPA: Rrf2 family transcriptional regulator [Verrucomicrobiae bacterium]